jgi:hypothetical protein
MNVCLNCFRFNNDLDYFLEEETTSTMNVVEDLDCVICSNYEAEDDDE